MNRRLKTVALTLVVPLGVVGAAASVGPVELISVTPSGGVGNGASDDPDVSGDGRFVVFESLATDLAAVGSAATRQIFLRDLQTQTTELVSVSTSGQPGNGLSFNPAVSSDGRYVVFESLSSDLVPGPMTATKDVFLRDRALATTERISVSSDGTLGDGPSEFATVTDDGRFVAFDSFATNLVAGRTNSEVEVYVRDRSNGTTEQITADAATTGYAHDPSISADGRFVAFSSTESDLVPKDTNQVADIFVFDRATARTERVSVGNSGKQGNGESTNPRISADGRFVVFESQSSKFGAKIENGQVGIFLRDRALSRTEVISVGLKRAVATASAYHPSVSADGRIVTFWSVAINLVTGDTNGADVFVRDRQTRVTERVSVTAAGGQLDQRSDVPRISRDGSTVTFTSYSAQLAAGDSNGVGDVFAVPLVLPPGNQPPVADAGPDQTLAATGAKTTVQLDGSASTDPHGTSLKYAWMENGKKIASGVRPKAKLAAGVHAITLIATDKKKLVGTDDVVVTLTP